MRRDTKASLFNSINNHKQKKESSKSITKLSSSWPKSSQEFKDSPIVGCLRVPSIIRSDKQNKPKTAEKRLTETNKSLEGCDNKYRIKHFLIANQMFYN